MKHLHLTLLLLIASPTALAGQRGPIIDVHLHAHAADRFGAPGIPDPVTGRPSAATTDDALIEATLDAMRRHGIVLGLASSALPSVRRWQQADPRRIWGGVQIDVGIAPPPLDEVRRDFAAGRLRFIGEIGAQWLGLAPGDSSLAPYFALAEELDVPVAVHTGIGDPGAPFNCCPRFRAALGSPLLLEEVLNRHPRLRLNLMHAGYPYLDETIALMAVYPGVYADVSVINWIIPRDEFHRYLQALVRAGFGKRLMFGSDQMIWPEAIGRAIEGVESAPFLSPDEKRDIFCRNAARFLRLEPDPC